MPRLARAQHRLNEYNRKMTDHEGGISLRPLTMDDAEAITALLGNDPEGIAKTARIPWPFTLADAREWLAKVVDDEGAWAIVRNGVFAGGIGLRISAGEAEVGYWIGKPFRGTGLATEALQLILSKARATGISRIQAFTFPDNAPSRRVLEKQGFVLVRECELDLPLRGGLRLTCVYALDLPTSPS